MRKIIGAVLISFLLLLGTTASVLAQSERACVGDFVSGLASELGSDFGQTIRQETEDFHPLGRTTVAPFATTCEFVE
jgi:hypothetical protein